MKKEAIKTLYLHGKITKEKVHSFVPKYISEEDYLEIVGE